MTNFVDEISKRKGWLDWLTSKLPGYSGYVQLEVRRDADKLLREQLVATLRRHLQRAETVTQQMLTGPGISQLDDMGRGNSRLQTLIDRVETASQGYTGFFATINIGRDELEALYEVDYTLLQQSDSLNKAIDRVQAAIDSGEGLAAAVRGYIDTVTTLSTMFDQRYEQMMALS